MKRSGFGPRTTPLRRSRTPVGARARARRQAGGPRALGRPSVSVAEWAATKIRVWVRDHGLCRVPWCDQRAADPHHVKNCSQGSGDQDEGVLSLCRRHHDQIIAPYAKGRLVITRDLACPGGFRFDVVTRVSKWASLFCPADSTGVGRNTVQAPPAPRRRTPGEVT